MLAAGCASEGWATAIAAEATMNKERMSRPLLFKDPRRLAGSGNLVERQSAEKSWRTRWKWPNEPMEPLFELTVTVPPAGSREIASNLFRQLKDAILEKRLRPGSRLPSTRDAQRIFGVSRNTVQ